MAHENACDFFAYMEYAQGQIPQRIVKLVIHTMQCTHCWLLWNYEKWLKINHWIVGLKHTWGQGPVQSKGTLYLIPTLGIPIVKIRPSYDRLISIMGFPIVVGRLYIKSGPWTCISLWMHWSSVWHRSNTGLSSTQYEQIPIMLGVWPFWLTPFFFRSITFWRAYG